MPRRVCHHCKKILTNTWQRKFCSNQCQADARYESFKSLWLTEKKPVSTKNISRYIKRYLLERFGDKCSLCGWREKNPITNRVPLEVDHIDGSAENNDNSNLRLLCPNCHALTSSFRNLNKGNGRSWRLKKLVREYK